MLLSEYKTVMIIPSTEPTKNHETVNIIRIIYFHILPPPHQKRKKYKTVTIIQRNDYLHN